MSMALEDDTQVSTMPSSQRTNLPSNWQILHHNRMVRKKSNTHHPCWGSLCREPCSTTPSSPQASLPASSRIRRRNCKDPPGPVAASVGHRCGGSCSTTPAWLGPPC